MLTTGGGSRGSFHSFTGPTARILGFACESVGVAITTGKELILFVEDDPAVHAAVRRRLLFEGYRVESAQTGDEAVERFNTVRPDLLVLDVTLPGMSGLEVAERIRSVSRTPIFMLTARDSVADRVAGLESGADDYLVKPFAIEELLARIRALLRRVGRNEQASVLRFSDLTMDTSTREVFRGPRSVALTAREFSLLEYFLRNPRQVLTREQIFTSVWGSDHMGESNIIDVNIKSLREKVESMDLPRLIHTVRGVGYSLREGS